MLKTDHAIHIKTIFCDIDGCIFKHHGDITAILANQFVLLPGVKEVFKSWAHKGYIIVLTTGRPESIRELTDKQIRGAGLYYHHLLMGLPRGQRIVINDMKPNSKVNTASCVNVKRNEGMKNVDV